MSFRYTFGWGFWEYRLPWNNASDGYFSLGCALLIIAGFGIYYVMSLFLADTATREFKITKTEESSNIKNVSIDNNFIYDEKTTYMKFVIGYLNG